MIAVSTWVSSIHLRFLQYAAAIWAYPGAVAPDDPSHHADGDGSRQLPTGLKFTHEECRQPKVISICTSDKDHASQA